MKKRIMIIILSITILTPGLSTLAASEIKVLNQHPLNPSEIILNFQLGDYEISQRFVKGNICDFIELKNNSYIYAYPLEKGAPSTPYITQSIIIPHNAKMAMEITDVQFKEIKVRKIVPSRGAVKLNQDPTEIPYEFGEVYHQDKWYPENFAVIGNPYILRDYRGLVVYFHPFVYNPVKGILRVAVSITVKVKKVGVSKMNTLNVEHKKVPQSFEGIYKSHFLNYPDNNTTSYPYIPGVGNMIVITTGEFQPAVEPLVEWKNRKGIKTDLYIYPTDTGPSVDDIKSFIQNIYDSEEGLAYILLVGDSEDVPPGRCNTAGAVGEASDPVYTLLAGEDEYADAMIGRFSVSNLTDAQTVVNKNLWYEMNPGPNGQWYHKAAGIADDDRYFTPNPRETIEEIREMMIAYNYTEFTRIYKPEATTSQVYEAVNQGRGWINAYHHGETSGWAGWYGYFFDIYDVAQLENTYMTPIIIAVSCSLGDFDGETCFAEAWQRHGSPGEPKGSIVFLGCSSTIWNFAWVGAKEINYHLVNENYFTAGGIIFNGVMKVIEMFPNGPNYEGADTFQLWHLFGDPSLFIYSDTPTEMRVTYDDRLRMGSTGFTVHVKAGSEPVENALVALYMNKKLYGSAYTNGSGIAKVILAEPLHDTGSMEVNVTAYNKMPYLGTVKIRGVVKKRSREKLFQ